MGSLFKLIRQPVLCEASMDWSQFWGIQCLWSTLVFLLEQPPYHYGSEVSGLFDCGVVDAAAAPLVGRLCCGAVRG